MPLTEELQFHIKIRRDDAGGYAILPGDPGRCEKIAAYLEEPAHIGSNREFNIWRGKISGERVLVCSTGIGGPSTAIAVEELAACGVHTFIRVGTCGGIVLGVRPGDIVIASGAVRQDGTSREYAPLEFPAVPDTDVLVALREAADKLGYASHTGIVQSKDSFYGQHSRENGSRRGTARQVGGMEKAQGAGQRDGGLNPLYGRLAARSSCRRGFSCHLESGAGCSRA